MLDSSTLVEMACVHNIVVDSEFKSLIPPLSSAEFNGLEEDLIKATKALVPLMLWNGILLDGHNRFSICTKIGLSYETLEVGEPYWTRTDARIWIRRNQLHRRNLDSLTRIEIALGLEEDLKDKAKENNRMSAAAAREVRALTLVACTKSEQDILPEQDRSHMLPVVAHIGTNTEDMPLPIKDDVAKKRIESQRHAPLQKRTIVPIDTRKEIAKAAGVSDATIHRAKLVLAKAPEAVREKIRKGESTINKEYKKLVDEAKDKERTERQDAALNSLPAVKSDRYRIIHCGVSELPIDSESIDCIITDPPYPKEFLHVYDALAVTAERVLKPGGSCFVMIGQSYLPDIIASLASRLTYQWTIAYMTPGGQATQLWQRKVNTFWKPVLWFVKGTYGGEWLGDVAQSRPNDNDKRFHHWGQSESGMADLVRRFSEPGHVVLDPFVGGGTTGVVALDLGRIFIGCDIDKKCVDKTTARLNEVIADAA